MGHITLNDRLRTWFLETYNFTTNFQSGFRRERKTNYHLVGLEAFIREAFIKKKISFCLFRSSEGI